MLFLISKAMSWLYGYTNVHVHCIIDWILRFHKIILKLYGHKKHTTDLLHIWSKLILKPEAHKSLYRGTYMYIFVQHKFPFKVQNVHL